MDQKEIVNPELEAKESQDLTQLDARDEFDVQEEHDEAMDGEAPENVGLVSVIVPVYNVENYLAKCIDTILRQSYPYFELLLIDDGSSDGSPKICDDYAQMDSRVKVIHKQNEGVSCTRNLGIEKASGDFIVFVDSDDGIGKHMLRKMIAAMTRYQTDLAICGYERFRENWKQRSRISPYSLVVFQSQMELASVYKKPATNMFGISIWAKMYRGDIIRENKIRFREDVHYEEDCLFNLDYFRHVTTTAVLRDYFYFYRQMDASLSKGYRKSNYPFLVQGYRARKAYFSELGMKSDTLDPILMIVVKTTFTKIYDSDLSTEEKLAEYQAIMAFEETKAVCKGALKSKSRVTRWIAQSCLEENSKKAYRVLWAWRTAGKIKPFAKKVLKKLKLRR